LRIVAGRHRGRKLNAPPGEDTRPDERPRREALLNILERGPPQLRGCRFLDLFAGTGAVALEALSRGAAAAVLVENARPAVAAIRANVAACREGERARPADGRRGELGRCSGEPFDIAFVDPPYLSGLLPPTLDR
jgi:16S rRNA (guanine966-N2)-methyltransferase